MRGIRSRHLRIECLENRRLLATYVVDSIADVIDPEDGLLTLREAIELSNESLDVDDVIRFSDTMAGDTILLVNGDLFVADDVVIDGPGADLLTIDASGNDATPMIDDGQGTRVFTIGDFSLPEFIVNVEIRGVTLTGGDDPAGGGAIRSNAGLLTVRDAIIHGNNTTGDAGAIRPLGGLLLERVWIDRNSASGDGGAIKAVFVTIVDSTLSYNYTGENGGALAMRGGQLTVVGSTISGNIAEQDAGAIDTNGTEMTIRNSTIVNNESFSNVWNRDSGVYVSATTVIENSIIALNENTMNLDLRGSSRIMTVTHSIIGRATGRIRPTGEDGLPDENGNLAGSSTAQFDPQLGPLIDSDGVAPVHAPLETSPAIDRGDPSFVGDAGMLDSRFLPRVSGGRLDMGAVELQYPTTDIDLNGDSAHDCLDVDYVVSTIGSNAYRSAFDLNVDGQVNDADLNQWLNSAGIHEVGDPFPRGDANLDGVVDGQDFTAWNENRFTAISSWCRGDLSADGFVDGTDFNIWNEAKFTVAAAPAVPVARSPRMAFIISQSVHRRQERQQQEAIFVDQLSTQVNSTSLVPVKPHDTETHSEKNWRHFVPPHNAQLEGDLPPSVVDSIVGDWDV